MWAKISVKCVTTFYLKNVLSQDILFFLCFIFIVHQDQCINYTEDKYKSRSGGGISDKLSFRAKYNSFAFAVNLQLKSLQLYPLQFGWLDDLGGEGKWGKERGESYKLEAFNF